MAGVTWNGQRIAQALLEAADKGLEEAAAHLLAESQKIVPYEKGELSRSGRSGLIGHGRAAVTYTAPSAVPAHERINVPPGRGRQRKYLETPFNAERGRMGAILADRIRQDMP